MATSQAGFFPVETYRTSSVTNGGTTVQSITRVIAENRTVVDTKNLSNTNSRSLTETLQADIGGTISFVIKNTNRSPVEIPIRVPQNPNTT